MVASQRIAISADDILYSLITALISYEKSAGAFTHPGLTNIMVDMT